MLSTTDLTFGRELKELFRTLSEETQRAEGARWGICDLVVDQPGRFRFSFSPDGRPE